MADRALVTGAYGFVGRSVARQLAASGWQVIGLGHGSWVRSEWSSWGLSDWRPESVTLDSLVTYAPDVRAIIHCAGGASVSYSVANPYQDFRRTVDSTAAVLEFARLYAKGARVVVASSAGVYGEVASSPIVETAVCAPVSPYGMHKRISEELCASYGTVHGVSSAVVRLFSVYGPGLRKQLLWDACTRLARDENRFFGTGREVRDWLHVRDAASLIAAAIDAAEPAVPIFNGGTGFGTAVETILAALFAALGRSDRPQFSREARAGDPSTLVADTTRAAALGWRPATTWRDGIEEYAAWYRAGAP
jgi:UDP-glucose 4-epimerase